ncbi:MAG: cyclic nucleotide-binding domain-containing protein, partial [Anaerolineaceae bacterium]
MDRSDITALVKSCFLFRQYSEEELDLIVDLFRSWDYEPGQLIFEQGTPAEHLFLVYSGKVAVFEGNCRSRRPLGLFESGDLFGYDMLRSGSLYQTSAVAKSDTTVLWLDQESAAFLINQFPLLHEDLEILFNSYLMDLQIPLTWREPDEVVYFFSRRHPMDLAIRLAPLLTWAAVSFIILAVLFSTFSAGLLPWVLTGINLGVILIWFILAVIDWSNDYSILTNRRVVFQE